MEHIQKNLEKIKREIALSCQRASRNPEEITLLAVSKTKPVSDMEVVLKNGINNFGENKAQEIINKYPEFSEPVNWHMIGHLQTNKVKSIIDKVVLIHSVDSIKLADKINDEAKKINKIQDILIQVNVAEEESKFGISAKDVEAFIKEASLLTNIKISGLMTIAPFVEEPEENRLIFRQLRQIFVDINSKNIDNVIMNTLSMGMTNDFNVAIEEGATIVRVGTAIFGQRNYN